MTQVHIYCCPFQQLNKGKGNENLPKLTVGQYLSADRLPTGYQQAIDSYIKLSLPTLSDYLGVFWIQTESPALPNESPNPLDKTNKIA